jgi:prepilin-type N-terminal cleavage/methylation domain-containing protein
VKKAFSLIELVFVIIIIGIMSVVLAPKMDDNSLQQGVNQIISHIRYTQHLALTDDKFNNSDRNWYKKRWQIQFSDNKTGDSVKNWKYVVYSDLTLSNNANSKSEVAHNPQNINQYLIGWKTSGLTITKSLNIEKTFGIKNIVFKDGCKGQSKKPSTRIFFDHIGRPFKGSPGSQSNAYDNNNLINSQCKIELTGNNNDKITIAIEPETGYVHQL